jgi:hypothetical protein
MAHLGDHRDDPVGPECLQLTNLRTVTGKTREHAPIHLFRFPLETGISVDFVAQRDIHALRFGALHASTDMQIGFD